jgi:hypothetical protein
LQRNVTIRHRSVDSLTLGFLFSPRSRQFGGAVTSRRGRGWFGQRHDFSPGELRSGAYRGQHNR